MLAKQGGNVVQFKVLKAPDCMVRVSGVPGRDRSR